MIATIPRPVLLLDVDGVLLPYGEPDEAPVVGYERATIPSPSGGTTDIRWSAEIVDELAELDAEIRWCSSWCTLPTEFSPNRILGPLFGWPQLSEATPADGFRLSDLHAGGWGWKWSAAMHVVDDEYRPLIWIDDAAVDILAIRRRGRRHRAVRQLSAQPHLVIAPDPHVGLTREDLRAVRRFVAGNLRHPPGRLVP